MRQPTQCLLSMSLRKHSSRKRRRSVAFPDDEKGQDNRASPRLSMEDETISVTEQADLGTDLQGANMEDGVLEQDSQERSLKEHAVWENFRHRYRKTR